MDEIRNIARKLFAYEPHLYPEDIWDETLEARIDRLKPEAQDVKDWNTSYAMAVKSGLYLWNQSLDKSHTLSQGIHHVTGSYWHGIMHRMEGDYSNSKYWFHRVGDHPIFSELHSRARQLLRDMRSSEPVRHERVNALLDQLENSSRWQPYVMIDCVELQVTLARDERADAILRAVQRLELELLLDYSYAQSFGGSLFDAV